MRKERREEAVGILPHSPVSTFSGRTEDDGSLRKMMEDDGSRTCLPEKRRGRACAGEI
jgi:hypothetical protein